MQDEVGSRAAWLDPLRRRTITTMRPQAHRRPRGMTLIEIMVVVVIVGFAAGGVVLSFRAVTRAQVRGSAQKMAAGIRYLYDRSVVTGKYYRLTVDLDASTYYAEVSDERFYLNAEKERGPGRGRAYDADAETKQLDEEEKDRRSHTQGLAAQLQPPPAPKRAHFQSFQDAMLPKITMSSAYVRDLYTPRQSEPYVSGKAFIYFFPDGHAERAVIHIASGRRRSEDDPAGSREDRSDVFTLILRPLTGRVELKNGDVEVPRDFDSVDDDGQSEGGR